MPSLNGFKICGLLVFFLALLIILNICVFYSNYNGRLSGGFFSQGKIIFSTGDEVKMASRVNFSKSGFLEFQKNGGWFRSAYREVVGHMGGDFIFRTVSAKSQPVSRLSSVFEVDDDMSFNQIYYLKVGGELTYLSVYSGGEGRCFYVKELARTRCFGSKS